MLPFSSFSCSASGASVVAIDNKIEQAMVSYSKINILKQKVIFKLPLYKLVYVVVCIVVV